MGCGSFGSFGYVESDCIVGLLAGKIARVAEEVVREMEDGL